MNTRSGHFLGALALLLFTGLPSAVAQGRTATPTGPKEPTFSRDILPIFQASCQACHRSGTSAPMSLVTYEETRPWGRAIKQKVMAREMPPWFSHRSVGEYVDDPSLTDTQIATITKWVDNGAPRGNPGDAPAPVEWPPSGWRLGEPDLVLTSPPVHVSAVAGDAFPEVEMVTGMKEDRYLRSIEVLSENDPVVHHLVVFTVGGDGAPLSEAGDDSRCAGGAGCEKLANVAKGASPDVFADGMSRLLRKGSSIRLQFHLHSNGKNLVERSRVGFRFYPKGYAPKHLLVAKAIASGTRLVIPPGVADYQSVFTYKFEREVTLVDFQPHMHYRGKRMTLDAMLPSGQIQALSDIDRFTQNWQVNYVYKNPPTFPAGTVLRVTSYHDNSAANKLNPDPTAVVTWGERSVDEMAIAHIDYYETSPLTPKLQDRR